MPNSKKIARLFPGAGPVIEPDRDLVETLADLLRRARRREIKGVGFFYVDGGNAVITGWCSGCADAHLMIAGASSLSYRVLRDWADAADNR